VAANLLGYPDVRHAKVIQTSEMSQYSSRVSNVELSTIAGESAQKMRNVLTLCP